MLSTNSSRLTQAMVCRRATTTATAALASTRRNVSTRPTMGGLASTAYEAAKLTLAAAATRRSLPPTVQPMPPLWSSLLHTGSNNSSNSIATTLRGIARVNRRALPRLSRASFFTSATATADVAAASSGIIAAVFALPTDQQHAALHTAKRFQSTSSCGGGGGLGRPTGALLSPKQQKGGAQDNQLQGVSSIDRYRQEEEEERREEQEQEDDPFNRSSGPGYLPFPPPFHTINIIMILLTANFLCFLVMRFGDDDWRDFVVEHFTLSLENAHRVYPIFTNAFYQENTLQLAIDCWLLWQFGDTMLAFLGNMRLTFFAALCIAGGSAIHIARQKFELYYGMDELEVRGRAYGPNPMIMGLICMEGLIFRHLNFIQQPPIPFVVLAALIMVIDVWRIFTTRPEEHGASTGGALMAALFWALPTRCLGLDKLTATM